ncbi:hypothetical protein ANCDUO_08000 [Ancylostoma duodenale]|uniref:Uncharacterized protein n=1 Tax=Ancylostoma duodenale TaxID=51022 RepID=A0A0C2DGZ5_9BILA|nr:hypothetical protein ANCDUO_08000 [Ancylostoma duodenale]
MDRGPGNPEWSIENSKKGADETITSGEVGDPVCCDNITRNTSYQDELCDRYTLALTKEPPKNLKEDRVGKLVLWNEEKFDFAITFSSIEHSGLGRYGDPIDPNGDLREVQKVMCLLKKGGLFLVGFPRGADAIKYNLHRIYGRMRLSMIMTGYEFLAMYRGDSPYPQYPRREDYEAMDTHQQDLYVLRKP